MRASCLLRTTSGPVLEKPGDLVGMLTTLRPHDVLFIVEIHRMRPVLEEFLYPAMEDYRVDVRIAEGPNAQTVPMRLEPYTLIGASTRYGMLTPPMRARFGLIERLDLGRLRAACATLLARNPSLRAGFTSDGAGEPVDLIRRALQVLAGER